MRNFQDIAMCASSVCPRSGTCYRAKATPDRYQTWSDFYVESQVECKWYMPIKGDNPVPSV